MHRALLWIPVSVLVMTNRVHAEPPGGYTFLAFDKGLRIATEQDQRR